MARAITTTVAMACILLGVAGLSAQQPGGASVGFRNQTSANIIVQGSTVINKVQRPGQILQLKKNGGMAFDVNIPAGIRYITIYDANQPTVVLLRDFPVPIQKRRDFLRHRPQPGQSENPDAGPGADARPIAVIFPTGEPCRVSGRVTPCNPAAYAARLAYYCNAAQLGRLCGTARLFSDLPIAHLPSPR